MAKSSTGSQRSVPAPARAKIAAAPAAAKPARAKIAAAPAAAKPVPESPGELARACKGSSIQVIVTAGEANERAIRTARIGAGRAAERKCLPERRPALWALSPCDVLTHGVLLLLQSPRPPHSVAARVATTAVTATSVTRRPARQHGDFNSGGDRLNQRRRRQRRRARRRCFRSPALHRARTARRPCSRMS